jgi:hypothetical protein
MTSRRYVSGKRPRDTTTASDAQSSHSEMKEKMAPITIAIKRHKRLTYEYKVHGSC